MPLCQHLKSTFGRISAINLHCSRYLLYPNANLQKFYRRKKAEVFTSAHLFK